MYKLSLIILLFFTACGSFNEADGELHYYNTISYGQQMLDLKKALDEGAVSHEEYDLLKEKILEDDIQIPELMDIEDY